MLEELARTGSSGVRRSSGDRIVATYVLQGSGRLAEAAEAVALEESTGLPVGLVPDGATARVGGEVLDVSVADVVAIQLPAAPLRRAGVEAAEIGTARIAWPSANATSIPGLLTMVLGEANETGTFGACRLVGLELPDDVLGLFPGPGHGARGVLEATRVRDRPLLGAIVKPSTGLDPSEHAGVAVELAEGGADFVKDDELLTDPRYCRLAGRLAVLPPLLDAVGKHRGRRVLYAANVTGPCHELRAGVEAVAGSRAGMVMVNVLAVGLDAFAHAMRDCPVPVFAHRVMSGAVARSTGVGLAPDVLCGLTRLCGADLVQVGSIRGKIFEDDAGVLRNADACGVDIPGVRTSLPVSGGGQDASTVAVTNEAFGRRDHCHLMGSGVFAHPDGPRAGVAAALDAWREVTGAPR